MSNILLNVNGIEVIYNHVILVLKGVSLQVPEGGVVALLGGNGAGKTTTLRAVSNLLAGERGEVTKGSIELGGERIEKLTTAAMVERGVILAPSGTRIEVGHLFSSPSADDSLQEFGLGLDGNLDLNHWEPGKELCEAVFNGVMTLEQVEAMLIETAVDKAHGNLSGASRMLGLTRPQLAYRLKRLHEPMPAAGGAES